MQERHWNEWGVAERVVILVKQPKDVDDCDNLIVGIKQFSTAASEMASSLWRMVFGDGEASYGRGAKRAEWSNCIASYGRDAKRAQ